MKLCITLKVSVRKELEFVRTRNPFFGLKILLMGFIRQIWNIKTIRCLLAFKSSGELKSNSLAFQAVDASVLRNLLFHISWHDIKIIQSMTSIHILAHLLERTNIRKSNLKSFNGGRWIHILELCTWLDSTYGDSSSSTCRIPKMYIQFINLAISKV